MKPAFLCVYIYKFEVKIYKQYNLENKFQIIKGHKMKKIVKPRLLLKAINKDYNEYDHIKSSKIGGIPYWPKSRDINELKEKEYCLIAQINLDEIDDQLLLSISKYYPTTGILQFFMNNCDEDYVFRTKVVYHNNYEEEHYIENEYGEFLINITKDMDNSNLPIQRNVLLSFKKASPDVFYIAEKESEYDKAEDKNNKMIEEQLVVSKLGGIPFIGQDGLSQEDFEDECEEISLLYLCYDCDYEDLEIHWGGDGEGSFLIKEKDLKNKNFEEVELNWSCG